MGNIFLVLNKLYELPLQGMSNHFLRYQHKSIPAFYFFLFAAISLQ